MGDIFSLGLVAMLLVPQNIHGEFGVGSRLTSDGAREAFFLLRIIVLWGYLKLHHLQKLLMLELVPVQDTLLLVAPGTVITGKELTGFLLGLQIQCSCVSVHVLATK